MRLASQTFRAEIQEELSMMETLVQHIRQIAELGSTLGVLASDCVRHSGLFERALGADYDVVYPDAQAQVALGVNGIKDICVR